MKNKHAQALGRLGGKVGGKARTERKAQASRSNGAKGGRPRKEPECPICPTEETYNLCHKETAP